MPRIGFIFAFLLILVSTQFARQSQPPAVEHSEHAGTIGFAKGSPVVLSSPAYTVEQTRGARLQWRIVGDTVSVRNKSHRPLRQLILLFEYKMGGQRGARRSSRSVYELRAGEMRVVHSTSNIRGYGRVQDWQLTVTVIGAEFVDGGRWAAPRDTARPLQSGTLRQPDSPLLIREFIWTDLGYRAKLQVGNERVVGYRLGIVRDAPGKFEVRIGRWVDLTHEQTSGKQIFADDMKSLSAKQIFPPQPCPRSAPQTPEPGERCGVAVFVAELRFGDGRRWEQDLERTALLWNN